MAVSIILLSIALILQKRDRASQKGPKNIKGLRLHKGPKPRTHAVMASTVRLQPPAARRLRAELRPVQTREPDFV